MAPHRDDRRESRQFFVGEEGLPLRQHKEEPNLAFQYQSSRLLGGFFFQFLSSSRQRETLGGKVMSEDEGGGSGSNTEEMRTEILHPCDGGRHAWFYLVGASMIEGLMWGEYNNHAI